jgi:hypothetical protein
MFYSQIDWQSPLKQNTVSLGGKALDRISTESYEKSYQSAKVALSN